MKAVASSTYAAGRPGAAFTCPSAVAIARSAGVGAAATSPGRSAASPNARVGPHPRTRRIPLTPPSLPRVAMPAVAAVEGCREEGKLGRDTLLLDTDPVAHEVGDVVGAARGAYHDVGHVVVGPPAVRKAGGVGRRGAGGVVGED